MLICFRASFELPDSEEGGNGGEFAQRKEAREECLRGVPKI